MEDCIMTLEDFVFNLPLYTKVGIADGYNDIVNRIGDSNEEISVEGYNANRKKDSTFSLKVLEMLLCVMIVVIQ